MTATETEWSIPGFENHPILGNCHEPGGDPIGVVLIAHGFKGYKDYGMFPRIARTLADAGFIAHRFNFSHSGMTNNIDTFERPELFELDTWNTQVHDFHAVIHALSAGILNGASVPFIMFGHSRGGVSALLTAGRHADDPQFSQPAGIVTAASPAVCNNLTDEQQRELLDAGFVLSPSSRTNQDLRVARTWLTEQLDDPDAHDLQALFSRIACPMLFIHGEADPTVPHGDADILLRASGANGRVVKIPEADHVFNTPNPLAEETASSPQLQQLLKHLTDFAVRICT